MTETQLTIHLYRWMIFSVTQILIRRSMFLSFYTRFSNFKLYSQCRKTEICNSLMCINASCTSLTLIGSFILKSKMIAVWVHTWELAQYKLYHFHVRLLNFFFGSSNNWERRILFYRIRALHVPNLTNTELFTSTFSKRIDTHFRIRIQWIHCKCTHWNIFTFKYAVWNRIWISNLICIKLYHWTWWNCIYIQLQWNYISPTIYNVH